jgi:tryptophan synthase alpha chain
MKIADQLSARREEGKKILSIFLTAGYPEAAATAPLVAALAGAGADLVEIGIPFSDPIADGPTIQHSSEVALRNGVNLRGVFGMMDEIRKSTSIPVILMGYTNPVMRYGLEAFARDCRLHGVDGTIIADLPPEESPAYRSAMTENGISSVFLAAPTTSDERLRMLDEASSGFLYCVSITGVTGARRSLASQAGEFVSRARKIIRRNSLLVGFGIATPDDARTMAALSDGIIIGSAFINVLRDSAPEKMTEYAADFVKSMRNAID